MFGLTFQLILGVIIDRLMDRYRYLHMEPKNILN